MKIATIGLDLAKTLFQVHGADSQGNIVVRKQLRRADVLPFFAKLEPCVVGMEACGSSHYWGRELTKLGHTVCLIAPQFVRPYVKSNKTDAADAEAICEAVSRPHMRFVPIKTQAQQAMLSLHRARAGLVKSCTALANQIRGSLCEFGIVLPQGIGLLGQRAIEALSNREHVPSITAGHSLFPRSCARTATGRPRSLLSPRGAIRGFHVPLMEVRRVRCLLWAGRYMGHESAIEKRCSYLRYRFGSSA